METPSSPKSKLKCWHPPNTTVHAKSLQSCLTLCNPMDYNPPIICPWDSLVKNNGVGCHALLQGIFLTHGFNLSPQHCRQFLYHISHQRSPAVKNLLEMQEMQDTLVWSLGWEGSLEEEMTTHSNILAWRIPMNRGAWWATVHGDAKSWVTEPHIILTKEVEGGYL